MAQGFSHLEAEAMSSEVLYQGLHFSKHNTLVSILENEFSKELPEPLPEELAPTLLGNKFIQAVFAKYDLTDDFDGSSEYDLLLHRTHRHDCRTHREQQLAYGEEGGYIEVTSNLNPIGSIGASRAKIYTPPHTPRDKQTLTKKPSQCLG